MNPQFEMETSIKSFLDRLSTEAPDTFSGQMCPRFVQCSFENKSLVLAIPAEPWMRNPGGAVHGGVIAEAISLTINALAWYYADKKQNPAVSIQLSYPRPALIGHDMFVEAKAIHAGKSIAYIGASAWQDEKSDKPFAIGTGVHYTAIATTDA